MKMTGLSELQVVMNKTDAVTNYKLKARMPILKMNKKLKKQIIMLHIMDFL
jgi:hypothetical protein